MILQVRPRLSLRHPRPHNGQPGRGHDGLPGRGHGGVLGRRPGRGPSRLPGRVPARVVGDRRVQEDERGRQEDLVIGPSDNRRQGLEGGRPVEGRPGEGRPEEERPGEGRPWEGRPGQSRPGEGRPGLLVDDPRANFYRWAALGS